MVISRAAVWRTVVCNLRLQGSKSLRRSRWCRCGRSRAGRRWSGCGTKWGMIFGGKARGVNTDSANHRKRDLTILLWALIYRPYMRGQVARCETTSNLSCHGVSTAIHRGIGTLARAKDTATPYLNSLPSSTYLAHCPSPRPRQSCRCPRPLHSQAVAPATAPSGCR